MKNILVPTDFSDCATNGTKIAMEIAKKTNSGIHFLHYTSIPIDWIGMDNQEKMYPDITKKVKDLQQKLNELVRECEKAGIDASCYMGYNESYLNILDHIKSNGIDLVVMGSHGTSGMKEAFIGSNAQKVLRLSSVPVLVVKPNRNRFMADDMTIVSSFPTIEEEGEGVINAFDDLLRLAKELDFYTHLLYINTPGTFTTSKTINSRVKPYLEKAEIEKLTLINASNLEEGIADYLEEYPTSLIAMITHSDTGIKRFLRGSQVESVVNHTDALILTRKI